MCVCVCVCMKQFKSYFIEFDSYQSVIQSKTKTLRKLRESKCLHVDYSELEDKLTKLASQMIVSEMYL